MKLSPDMIREQRFKTRLSGFDRNEVIAFLLDMAEDMELLIEENSLLKGEVEAAKRRQKDMEDLFLTVKQFSEERMRRAELEAKDVLAEAERKASETQQAAVQKLRDAEHRAQELQGQAMQKAREILREAERTKQELERGLSDVRDKRASLMSELTSTLESYQAWIRTQGNRDQGNVV